MVRLLALLLCLSDSAWAEQVVLGLSKDQVAITATFDGSEILLFGAVKREQTIPEGPLDVIVTISGPSEPVTVRRKDRRFGIWINTDAVEVDAAPSFYAVATTRPLTEALSDVEDLRHRISIPRAIRSVGAPMTVTDTENFTDALIRIRTSEDRYQQLDGQVDLTEATLFNTSIALPANLTEGKYEARIYLTREGAVVSDYSTTIDVRKVGLERFLYTLAHEQPLVYGLLSLFIAIAAGWGASAAFRMIKV
jgi:uncharacterized protein (TIGR02186 family)